MPKSIFITMQFSLPLVNCLRKFDMWIQHVVSNCNENAYLPILCRSGHSGEELPCKLKGKLHRVKLHAPSWNYIYPEIPHPLRCQIKGILHSKSIISGLIFNLNIVTYCNLFVHALPRNAWPLILITSLHAW